MHSREPHPFPPEAPFLAPLPLFLESSGRNIQVALGEKNIFPQHHQVAESLPIRNSINRGSLPRAKAQNLTTRTEKKKLAKPRWGGNIQQKSRRRGCPHDRKKASGQSSSLRSNLAEIHRLLWQQVANPSLFIDGKTKAQGSSCSYRMTSGQ